MGNLNCLSAKDGDSVTDWIRRETKTGKKKRHIDDLVADVINQEKTDKFPKIKKKNRRCKNKQEDMKTDQKKESGHMDNKQLTSDDLIRKVSVKESIDSKHGDHAHPNDKQHDAYQTYSDENEIKDAGNRKRIQECSDKTCDDKSDDTFDQAEFSNADISVKEAEHVHETNEQRPQSPLSTNEINEENSEHEYSSLLSESSLIRGLIPRVKPLPIRMCQDTVSDEAAPGTLNQSTCSLASVTNEGNSQQKHMGLQSGSGLSVGLTSRANALPLRTCQETVADETPSKTLNTSPSKHDAEAEAITQCYKMMKHGTRHWPQVRAIQRIKQDTSNFYNNSKDIPNEDKRGSIAELKWSRHVLHIQSTEESQERNQRYQDMQKKKFLGEKMSKEVPIDVCAGSRYSSYVSQTNRNPSTCDNTYTKSSTKMINRQPEGNTTEGNNTSRGDNALGRQTSFTNMK